MKRNLYLSLVFMSIYAQDTSQTPHTLSEKPSNVEVNFTVSNSHDVQTQHLASILQALAKNQQPIIVIQQPPQPAPTSWTKAIAGTLLSVGLQVAVSYATRGTSSAPTTRPVLTLPGGRPLNPQSINAIKELLINSSKNKR